MVTTYVTNYTTIQSGSPLFFYLTNNFIMIVLFMSSRKEAGKKLCLKSKSRMIAFHDENSLAVFLTESLVADLSNAAFGKIIAVYGHIDENGSSVRK